MKSTHGGCETSFLLSKFVYRKSYLSTIYIKKKKRKKYSANFKNQVIEKGKWARAAWLGPIGTCAPLPFHVTGGQPAVGRLWGKEWLYMHEKRT
ncbi:unnamed protein product [Spirodela intermedia]|uniref:Uncharacterized protein n=1 Tax=Spirodela intermedia TaxID=51605 RepID=A0A7I8IAJ7_SPIIN|nr:unnamed protein product [Spirodela intermedia]CAA6654610.1 unnamed protein product [Spirodela intermedia]